MKGLARRRIGPSLGLSALALVVAAVFVPTAGCERNEAARRDGDAAVVDTEVMAFLSAARALHHEANLAEDTTDLSGALAAMDRLIALPRPHPEDRVPEVEEVLADAHARLAELRLRSNDLDGAARAIEEGLTHAREVTYFRGHLLEVKGLVAEARVARLADAGKIDEAAQARAEAIRLLEEAVSVQEQVIQRALDADGGARRTDR